MTTKFPAAFAAATFMLAGLSSSKVSADTFTVINTSNKPVYAAVLYWTPESSRTGDLMVFTPASWTAKGWYRIAPGKKGNIYSGSRKKIYVRLSKGSLRNVDVVHPRKSEKKTCYGARSERFQITETGPKGRKYFTVRYGDRLQNRKTGSSLKAAGASTATGFHYVKAHTNFTVR